ncbi:hypothetical protein [Amycolatopsis saalfeldensis]|uniref:hypothetical protein n=1 Tax=Amycolatopsis saalfeldensis TaxID=394193 RepID=UPI0011604F72|nr:hypothetical protein [Amycolatopsis saalfeldensis]
MTLVVAAISVGCSGPGSDGSPTATPATPDAGTTSATVPASGQFTLPTAAPVTPTSGAGAPSGIPAPAPAPEPTPALYADPVAVARAWMGQFCETSFEEPINANLTRAGVYATGAGTAADTERGDTPDTYQQMREQKLTTRCDQVEAQVNPDAPATPDMVYVEVSATSTQLAAGLPFQTSPVISTRRVVRGGDGRWLVDVAVDAG